MTEASKKNPTEAPTVLDDELSILRAGQTSYPSSVDEASLETFDNRYPERAYLVRFDCPEFTSLCPITGQPDFAHLIIEYVPDRRCVESKSLKLYLHAYRNEGSFGEAIVNRVLEDLVAACAPRRAMVQGKFTARGGISIEVVARFPDDSSV